MRDHCSVEGGRGGAYVALCQCCSCKISGSARGAGGGGGGGLGEEFCEPCLQVVKQCPPKKRFMRGAGMKPRPIIVKPASSIALDRLVEVALSPTGCLDAATEFRSPSPKVVVDDPGVASCEVPPAVDQDSPNCSSKKKPSTVQRYSLPLETVQKLKRLSSFDENLPQPTRSSKADHSKKFTPRFKSLLDISC